MRKAVAYVRVSSREQKIEGYSIPAQKKFLHEYARVHGFRIVEIFEDDETAKRAGRTNFGKMLEYLRNHKDVEYILVEKTDRLYRNLKDYVTLDELDVTTVLAKENEMIGKNATSHQKLIHGIKVLMAKNYSDNLSEEVRKGQKEKAESGIYPGSNPPLGYKMGEIDGKLCPVVDNKNKDFAIRLFEYYATSLYSIEALIQKVKNEGLFIPSNMPSCSRMKTLTKSTLQRILRNPFYYGDFLWKGELLHGTHEPLISKELWDKVQAIMSRFENKSAPNKYNALPFTFKGLFTCGKCGRGMTAERHIKKSGLEFVYYKCTKYKTHCEEKPINEVIIHNEIAKGLVGLQMPQKAVEYVAEGLKQSLEIKRNTVDKTRNALVEEKMRLEDKLDKLYEDKIDGTITKTYYEKKAKEWEKQLADTEDKISKHTKANTNYYKIGSSILELANNAEILYERATTDEKQELLAFLLSNSTVTGKKPLIQYKKPFDRIVKRASCSDWRERRDSNPRPTA